MKAIIFINNMYHKYDNEILGCQIGNIEFYCNRRNIEIHKIVVVNSIEEKNNFLQTVIKENALSLGDIVITMEISDISNNDTETKNFVLALCKKGIKFRAFYEFFNTETINEKELLIHCLEILENASYNVPF